MCALHLLELIIELSELKQIDVSDEKLFYSDTGIRDVSAGICEPSSGSQGGRGHDFWRRVSHVQDRANTLSSRLMVLVRSLLISIASLKGKENVTSVIPVSE